MADTSADRPSQSMCEQLLSRFANMSHSCQPSRNLVGKLAVDWRGIFFIQGEPVYSKRWVWFIVRQLDVVARFTHLKAQCSRVLQNFHRWQYDCCLCDYSNIMIIIINIRTLLSATNFTWCEFIIILMLLCLVLIVHHMQCVKPTGSLRISLTWTFLRFSCELLKKPFVQNLWHHLGYCIFATICKLFKYFKTSNMWRATKNVVSVAQQWLYEPVSS